MLRLGWHTDLEEKRRIQRRYLDKTVIFTDRNELSSDRIVLSSRNLNR